MSDWLIVLAAWGLMVVIAIFCNVLLGLATRADKSKTIFLLILPIVVSISFLLLADLDSPRGGIILVQPMDLLSLAQSLHQ